LIAYTQICGQKSSWNVVVLHFVLNVFDNLIASHSSVPNISPKQTFTPWLTHCLNRIKCTWIHDEKDYKLRKAKILTLTYDRLKIKMKMTLGCLHDFTPCSPSQYMFESVTI
jgi:hypothetical protein